MARLGQPFITWSDGLLATNNNIIDLQHQWFLTLINIMIHLCNGNTLQVKLIDVLKAIQEYACIHFTEEELLFMNHSYPCNVNYIELMFILNPH